VFSYSRRGSRLSAAHARVWELNAGRWWIPDELVDEPGFALADRFERRAPLAVEIGSGSGEATAALAAAHPNILITILGNWTRDFSERLRHANEEISALE
jgi:tRNA (guanine-N7-)-methyltransferase